MRALGVEADGQAFAHAAGPAPDADDDRAAMAFAWARQDLFDPTPLDPGFACFGGQAVDLVGGRRIDEPSHDGAGDDGVAAAGRLRQVEDE
ncbi:hypothetical protein LTR94_036740, partial [Friedmanniomyces endolithicus]